MECCCGGCWAAKAAGTRARGQSPGGGVACLEIAGWPRRQRPAPGLPVYLCCELAPQRARCLPFPVLIPSPARLGSARPSLKLAVALTAARLQSEWAAEMYWGVRGDASVSRGPVSRAGCPNVGRRPGWDTGRGSSVQKSFGWSGYLAVKREQHVHGRQAAIKITTLKHAPSLPSAQSLYTSGMTPLSIHSCLTLSFTIPAVASPEIYGSP